MTRIASPGLHVSSHVTTKRRRMLPVPGEIVVEKGQSVEMNDPVARADLPATPVPVRAAAILGLPPAELKTVVTVVEADPSKRFSFTVSSRREYFGVGL